MGDLNCPAHHWYRHVQPSISTEMVRGGQGHPCPPLCMGQAPPHILLHLAPAEQNRGCSAKLGQPASFWGVQTSCPRVVEGPHMSPPPAGRAEQGGVEERVHASTCQGICSTCPFSCPASSSQVPHLTCNLHQSLTFTAAGRNHIPSLWLGFPSHMAAPSVPAHVLVLKRHA